MSTQPISFKLNTIAALTSLSCTLALVAAPNAQAATLNLAAIDQLYVFGDSLVDTGNLFQATGGAFPPPFLYAQGRFSNGPLWVENLALNLGLPPNPTTNFGFGGSSSGLGNAVLPAAPFPGLLGQVSLFAGLTPVADPNALYILSGGANDYLFGGVTSSATPVSNLTQAILALTSIGAKNFLVPNLADLGQLPGTRTTPVAATLTALTDQHNAALTQSLLALQPQVDPDVNLLVLDTRSLFDRVTRTPTEFGLTNVTDACLQGLSVCSHPGQSLFWDDFHPTAAGHAILASSATSTLQAAAVPEPSSILGLLTVGALGARLRRKNPAKLNPAKSKV
jgi:phospholipase/lecithinase/hemolysin